MNQFTNSTGSYPNKSLRLVSTRASGKIDSIKFIILTALFLTIAHLSFGQEAVEPRPSPMAVAATQQGDTYVKIVYSRPHKRGREIFGSELAPYGKVWRLGANEATEITTTENIKVGGKTLKAGTYAMFAIPQEDEWTVIFNRGLGQWGAYDYDQSQDALRLDVPTQEAETTYEPFTIMFGEEGTELTMVWDKTKVVLPIKW